MKVWRIVASASAILTYLPLRTFAFAVMESNDAPENTDRLTRWQDRWEANKIGWHQEEVHNALLNHGDKIIPNFNDDACLAATPVRVLVPLCGKTVDMAFLAKKQGVASVVGVDGVRKALETFAEEHPDLEIQPSAADQSGRYERLVGKKIALLQGDFFELDELATDGRFEVILDRASLVAIDPKLREAYVDVMGRLIQPGGKILLVVIERRTGTEEDKNGPPFSVPDAEVRRLYQGQEWVKSLTLIEDQGEKKRNTSPDMVSLYYLIEAK